MNELSSTFTELALYPELQKKLADSGFTTPTDIQRKAIPMLLAAHPVDFHGQAQTGTGKTLAFGLPLFHRIDRTKRTTQALVLAPTRELAVQICDSLKPLAETIGVSVEAVYGGMSMEVQFQRLKRGVQIVIGTPGRINDHLRRKSLTLDNVKTLVLDEADIMLDLGFKEDIDVILDDLPQEREVWLFSATVKGGIDEILRTHMTQPKSVRVSKDDVAAQTTKHFYCATPMSGRLNALCRFIDCYQDFYGFVFCQTKMLTADIAEQMLMRGYKIGALHGDMSQAQRNAIIRRFRAKEITILVATDVAARGIDVANLTHVINFSFPNDQESYIHRSGRTGRAGKEGIAITFVGRHEMRDVRQMQSKYKIEINPIDVPDRAMLINSRLKGLGACIAKIQETVYAPVAQLTEALAAQNEEQLRHLAYGLLHEKFLTLSNDQDQFSTTPRLDERQQAGGAEGADYAEFSIPVGSDDNVDREQVAQFLVERALAPEMITKIRVLKRCTFVHCAPANIDACMAAIQGGTLAGKSVRATRVHADPARRSGGFFPRSGGGPRRNSYAGGGSEGYQQRTPGSYRGNSFGRSGGYHRDRDNAEGGTGGTGRSGGYRRDNAEGGFGKPSGGYHRDNAEGGFERKRSGFGYRGGSGQGRESHGSYQGGERGSRTPRGRQTSYTE